MSILEYYRRRRVLKKRGSGGDSSIPTLSGQTPAGGATGIEPDASISLTIIDPESVVTLASVGVTVAGANAVVAGSIQSAFNGTGASITQVGNDVQIVLVPTNEFQYRASVTVGVTATSDGGTLSTSYSFTVRDVSAMVSFNGSDEYLANSDGLTATLGGSAAMTLSIWSRTDADTSGALISNSNESSQNMFSVLAQNNVRSIQVRIPTAVGSEAEYAQVYAGEVNLVTWRHIVVRFDGSQADNAGRLRVWVNGIERTGDHIAYTGTIPATLTSPTVGLGVGRYGGAASLFDTAYHGHIAIWDSALATGDIESLFGDGRITNPRALATKPLHFWRMDGTDDLVNANGVVDRGSSATKRHLSAQNMDASNASANVPPQIRNVITAYTWDLGHVGGDHTHSSWPASVGTLTLAPTGEANQWTQDVATPFMRSSAVPSGVHNEGLYRNASTNVFQAARTYPSASIHVRHIGYILTAEAATSYAKWQWKKDGTNDYVNLYYTSASSYSSSCRHQTADAGQFNAGGTSSVISGAIEPDAIPRPVLWDSFYLYDPDADTWTHSLHINGVYQGVLSYSSVTSHPFAGDSMDYSLQGGLSGEYAMCGVWYREVSNTYDPDAFRAEHMRDLYSLGG